MEILIKDMERDLDIEIGDLFLDNNEEELYIYSSLTNDNFALVSVQGTHVYCGHMFSSDNYLLDFTKELIRERTLIHYPKHKHNIKITID